MIHPIPVEKSVLFTQVHSFNPPVASWSCQRWFNLYYMKTNELEPTRISVFSDFDTLRPCAHDAKQHQH